MDNSLIRSKARESLKGNWWIAILASIIASALGAIGTGSISFNSGSSDIEDQLVALDGTPLYDLIGDNLPIILSVIGAFAAVGLIVSLVLFCLGSIVRLGYSRFNLDLVSYQKPEIRTLFSYFKNWKNAILTRLLENVLIFLWTLACVIPGIIAEYKYAMVPYILAENPDISPKDAIERSKIIMNGNKMQLFTLRLSFIGWHILSIMSCGIGYIWLTPYINAAEAEFYKTISFDPTLSQP